jgi:outer membrane immunogenic protein
VRRLVIASLLLVVPGATHAADRNWSRATDDNWTGLYVGANFGYGNANASADFTLPGVPLVNGSEKLTGVVYGVQAGYNYQLGRFVLGVETDIQATTQKANGASVCAALACGVAITQTSEDSIPWLGTLRLRAGVAFDRFLVYGTGGAAYGDFKSTQTMTTVLGSVTTAVSNQRPAWVIGGGVEAMLTRNWSVKFEYLYLDTGRFTTTYSLAGIGLITDESRMTDNIVRLGVNYRF